MDLSDDDLGLAARTVVGEAGNQSDVGQSAVAHVILNRLATGQYGNTASDVVLQPGAFEPWQTRAKELGNIDPNSDAYKRAASIVAAAAAGSDDPTQGATHFLAPKLMQARGAPLPKWAKGNSIAIGDQQFFAPGNPNYGDGGISAINAAIGAPAAQTVPSSALGYMDTPNNATPGALFKSAGFDVPTKPAPSLFKDAGFDLSPGAPSLPQGSALPAGSLFKNAGFALPTDKATAPPGPVVQMLGDRPLESWEVTPGAQNPNPAPPAKSALEQIHDAIEPSRIIGNAARDTWDSGWQNFKSGSALATSGWQDLKNGNVLPSFPSTDPSTWSGGGALKSAGGVLGMATAPLSGALDALVGHPVTALTGNPDIGNRAELVANMALGLPKTVAVAKSTLPANRAISTLVNAVGPENVPAAVARLNANPRLSLMDVSDPVRTMAQGLIDPAQPTAQNILSTAVKARMATAPGAVNAAYTDAMGAAPDVVKTVAALKQRAQDVGSKIIQPAIANAGPVDITNVVNSLDKTIGPYALKALQAGETPKLPMTAAQQTAWDLRQRLRGDLPDRSTMFMDPAQAHEIQSQMRYEASQLGSSAVGSERLTSGQIGNVRGQLVNAIDDASGGTYKPALAKYRDAMTVQEAFESGFDTLKNRSGVAGLDDRPEAFQQWMNNASPEEIAARQLGTRADIDQKINGVRSAARQGADIPSIEYNQQKLKMLFGEGPASQIIRKMNDIRDEAVTNSKILANSKTAETLAGQRALTVPKVEPFRLGSMTSALLPSALGEVAAEYMGAPAGLTGAGMFAGGLALGGARKAAQVIQRQSALARNVAIARAASATGPARQKTINALLSHPQVVRGLQKSGNALTSP